MLDSQLLVFLHLIPLAAVMQLSFSKFCHRSSRLLAYLHEGELLLLTHSPDPAAHFNLLLVLTTFTAAGLHFLQVCAGNIPDEVTTW